MHLSCLEINTGLTYQGKPGADYCLELSGADCLSKGCNFYHLRGETSVINSQEDINKAGGLHQQALRARLPAGLGPGSPFSFIASARARDGLGRALGQQVP